MMSLYSYAIHSSLNLHHARSYSLIRRGRVACLKLTRNKVDVNKNKETLRLNLYNTHYIAQLLSKWPRHSPLLLILVSLVWSTRTLFLLLSLSSFRGIWSWFALAQEQLNWRRNLIGNKLLSLWDIWVKVKHDKNRGKQRQMNFYRRFYLQAVLCVRIVCSAVCYEFALANVSRRKVMSRWSVYTRE